MDDELLVKLVDALVQEACNFGYYEDQGTPLQAEQARDRTHEARSKLLFEVHKLLRSGAK